MGFRLLHKVVRRFFFALPAGAAFKTFAVLLFTTLRLCAAVSDSRPLPFPVSFVTSDYNGFGVSCNGGSDGEIDLTINGGVGPFTITWSNGALTEDITGLIAGNYVVTIIDATQDTTIDSVLITEPPVIAIAFTTVDSVSCNGLSDGSIDITAIGGTGVFTYEWSGGSTSEDTTGLAIGNYTVTVTDNNGCSLSDNTFIREPDVIVSNLVTQDANGIPDGQASVTPTGGTGVFTYQWSTGAILSSIIGLLPGSYTVTITDANLCTATEVAVINNALGICTIITDSVLQVSCNGADDGAIYINTFAAIAPITYEWSNGAITQDVTGLAPGTYTVTITDVVLCTATETFVITEPVVLDVVLTPTPQTCGNSNGSVTSVVTGGTGTYTYLWSNSATTSSSTGLNPGTYTVTVTDQNGCTVVDAAVVTSITPPQVVVDSIQHVNCFGGATGAVYTTTINGTLPYTILWSNSSSSQDITGLIAGTYTITVTDANLCTTTASGIVTQPLAALNDSVHTTNPTCGLSNGSIISYPYNGTSPYTYLWSNAQTTQTISGLAPGTYTVTITDANLCTRQRVATITNVAGPVASVDSIRAVKCFGGLTGGVFISIVGGTAPVTYLWSNSATTQDIQNVAVGTYTVTATDANLCTSVTSGIVTQPLAALNDSVRTTNPTCGLNNGSIISYPYNGTSPYTYLWSNAQTTQTISALAPGTYTVTITDANLCTRQRVATITNVAGPVASVDSIRTVKCFGGLTGGVFISIVGGTAPVTYLWSNSATTQDIQNVAAGTYTVTATDANLCTSVTSGIVTQPLAALNDSVRTTNPTCGLNNGSIISYPYNGTSPYTYLWSNAQTTQTISALAPGTYTVTITDANLCTRQRTSVLTNIAGPVASVDSIRAVRCFGGLTGGVFISIVGGTAPVTYLWSNSATTQDIQNVAAGTYTVTATDANLCTSVTSGIVTQPLTALNDSVRSTNPTCGLNNGSIISYPYNGTSPYTYLWSNAQTTQTISALAPGSYTVTITDANLCTRQRTSVIANISGPVASVDSIRAVRCFGGLTGGVFISIVGGTAPVTYLWSNSATTQDIQNVAAGTYTVTATDANLCTSVTSGIVTQPLAALNDSAQTTNPTCGNSNGTITEFPYSGTSPYTYLWSNSQTTQTISALAPGSYTVTITDANLCTRQRTSVLTNIAGPVASVDSIRAVRCFGGLTGGVFISIVGGTTPVTYLWSNSATTQDIQNVAAGTYTVTATDANLCTSVTSGIVTQPLAALNDSVQTTNPTCGLSNGSITEFPYSGTGPYTYLWSNAQVTQTISALAPGSYTVTITDANLCTRQRTSVIANISGPVASVDSIRAVRCFGGLTGGVFISIVGGTAPVTYLWSNSATTQDIQNVAAGTYTVTATDANLCTSVTSGIVTQPLAALNDSAQTTSPTCGNSNGSITEFPYSGTSPYTYLWSNAQTTQTISALAPGSYTVTITDANLCTRQRTSVLTNIAGPVASVDSIRAVGCFGGLTGGVFISILGGTAPVTYLWSNSATTQDIQNVAAGTYTVTATDANLCTSVTSGIVTQPLAALNDSVQTTNPACGNNNGSITEFPYSGTSPYTYLWSNAQTTQTISALAPGSYTVTITDANLCTRQRTSVLTNVAGPVAIVDSVRSVRCFGGSTGGVFITVLSGTLPFTYLWSNGAVTQDIQNVTAGIKTVTVTDGNSCTTTLNATVTQPSAALNDSVQTTSPACGNNGGSITEFPYNGTSPYTYLWSNSATTQTISSLVAGSYTVTITDANLCTRQRTSTLTNIAGPVAALDSVIAVKCFGDATGGVFISVIGGTAPLTYLWSNSAVTQDIQNVLAGTYTVTVSDANLCTSVVSGIVTQPAAALNDSVQTTNPTCGNINGSITSFPFSGTSPYTYLWSNSAITQTISGLATGTYTVTITDANLCTRQRTSNLINVGGPTLQVDSIRNINCFGGATGGVFISVIGGVGPFTYLWSNGAVTQDIQNVIAGIKAVTVTDANSCTANISGTVTQPLAALNDSIQSTRPSCNLNNGTMTVFPYNGTSPYTFLWNNSQTTQTISGLAAGTYTVTITDANLCTRLHAVTINPVLAPVASLDSVVNARCFGTATGGVFISITGGAAPLTYLWSNSAVTQDIQNVGVGTYTVTVTDASLCTSVVSGTVTQPPAISDSVNVTNVSCGAGNGSITIYPFGGTPGYTYLWSNLQTTQTISGLSAASYTVTITDANLCTRLRIVSVSNLAVPVAVIDSIHNVRCFGGSTGEVFVSVSGGLAPITYQWSNGAITQDIQNLPIGNYTVTVTDANSCTSIADSTITQPAVLVVNNSVTNAACGQATGAITANPTGGTAPFGYLWNNGLTTQTITGLLASTYTVTVTDVNGCTALKASTVGAISGPVLVLDSIRHVRCNGAATGAIFIHVNGGVSPFGYQWTGGATSQDLLNVIAGTYTVTITDNNNCTSTLTGTITQPPVLNDSIQTTNAFCGAPTGSATVFPYGGTSPYTFLWSTGATTATVINLNTGNYTVTITDAFSCTRQAIAAIINSGGPAVTIDSIRNVKCNGALTGGVFITVIGASPFTYLWSNAAITQDITGVGAGTYTVTVTDSNSCSVVVSGTVTQPTLLNDSTVTVNSTCGSPNGSVTTFPYGGVPNYSYLWNNGQITQTISNLTPGIYTVTVTDQNGCTVVRNDTVFSTGGPIVLVDSILHIDCFGNAAGAIYVTATGGTNPLTYLWSNNAVTQDLTGVLAGTYTVTVTDFNSCTASATATILQSTQLQDSVQVTPEACNSSNGAIDLFPYGGTPPYSFLWSNSSITQNISGLLGGTFTVTITDSLGCQEITTVVVPQAGGPSITLDSLINVSCFGGSDGAIYISITGGTAPLTYAWSNSEVTEDVTNLQVGNYSVIVTDDFLCRDTAVFVLTEPLLLEDSVTTTPATCGLSNGSATSFPYGGTGPYTYLWSNSQITQTAVNLGAGTYTVTVTDDNSCTVVQQAIVAANAVQVVTTDSIVNVSCNGSTNGAIYITVTGGVPTITYLWSNSEVTEDITGLAPGNYTVTVTDNNSCSVIQTFTVAEPDVLADSTEVNNSTCGLANGTATIYPYGGTLPYTYLWNTGSGSQSISNLVSAIYTVTVTDFHGCTLIETMAVGDVGGPEVTLDSIVDVSCNNGNDGAIYITVTSGLPPFNYLWSNFANTPDITGLVAGVYSLTVTDQSNCQQFVTYTVNEPNALLDSATITSSSCGGSNGAITVYPYGGTSPYSYLWNTGAVTQTITGLTAANYTVTVTDDNSCTVITQYVLNNLSGPVITVDSVQHVKCADDSTGAIYLTVTNGTAPYLYSWSNGAVTQDIINLLAGTYTVTVTDQNSCTATVANTIIEPLPVSVIFTSSPANCNVANGALSAAISGGVPGYDLLWNNFAITPNISNLAAGVYTLTVTDDNNCVSVFNTAVTNIAAPVITLVDSGNVSCFGLADGFITVDVTGGAQPYQYDWTNTLQTGNQLINLTGNITYTLTITDSLGCIAILPVFIDEPDPFIVNSTIPQMNGTYNLSCNGSNDGSIDLDVTGGTQPYQYLWSNFALSDSIGSLSAGTYTVTITDANSCSFSQSFILTQPPLLVSNAGPNKVLCGFNSDTLAADIPVFGTGYWLVVSGTGTFANANDPHTVVTGLTNGVNVYQWVVTDGICSAFSQVVITFSTQINAIAGVDKEVCENSALLTATAPQFGYGYWQIVNSDGIIDDSTQAVTAVSGLNPGPNIFRWFVLNGTCIDSADVNIFLNDPSDCFEELEMPTGFTPNGDGMNDYFFIKGIDDYPDNIITVFNRWGNKVFEKSGYANDWSGTNNSGDPLFDGTYFVIFKVRSIDKIVTTYVDLRR